MNDDPEWVDAVLNFWFRELGEAHWFAGSEDVDEQIRGRFLMLHERVVSSEARGLASARAVLASVIVLDQFSRNLFRGTSRAFTSDPLARRLAKQAVTDGLDVALTNEEKLFLYLPFQHSEDRTDQALSVDLTRRLGNEEWTRYAEAHKAIIDRFGRFPHRNAVLGRTSSKDEIACLQEPMGSF